VEDDEAKMPPPPSGVCGGPPARTRSVPPGLQAPAAADTAAPTAPWLPVLLMLPALGLRRISPAKG
jgi:hypothetical protein